MALTEDDSQMVRTMIRDNIVSLLNGELNIKQPSNKFFLTQFNEREEDENKPQRKSNVKDENTALAIPEGKAGVVKQGLELKLQRNILAKYRNDEEKVTKELLKKREEFEQRINFCKEKHGEIILKQNKNQQLVTQYSQFITEKETIRKRAVVKYQGELKVRLQKMLEYDILMKELEETRTKHEKNGLRVENNKKFKDFLSKAIDLLPENYLEAGESKYISLMSRHQTLLESNLDLFDNLMANSDKLKVLRNEHERLIIEHNENKMKVNSKLGELSKIKEEYVLKNDRTESDLARDGEKKRERVVDLSKIFWGVDNLAAKCMDKYRLQNRTIESISMTEKLGHIKDYMIKQSEIINIIHKNQSKSESSASY